MDADLQDSGVDEEEFNSLLTGDGEEEVEADVDEQSAAETEETQENEEATEEVPEDALDWEKVDPRVKAEYDKVMQASQKWEKAHSKLQSDYTKSSQSAKQREEAFKQHEEKVRIFDELDKKF